MNIAVLGSTGYLGKKLVKALARNNKVLCIKLPSSIFFDNDIIYNSNIEICNVEDTKNILKNNKYDCFVNLSCLYQRKGVLDIDIFNANFFSPLKLFLLFKENGIKKHITIDTSLPKNVNIYSFAKKTYAEVLKQYSSISKDLSIVNVILENFYGPDEPKDRFLPSVIEKMKKNEDILLTDGTQKRDWIFVDDVIECLCKIIDVNFSSSYIDVPLGTGESIEVRKVIEYLKEITQSKSNLLFGAIRKRANEPDTKADVSVLNNYGIKVKYMWRDGLKKLI